MKAVNSVPNAVVPGPAKVLVTKNSFPVLNRSFGEFRWRSGIFHVGTDFLATNKILCLTTRDERKGCLHELAIRKLSCLTLHVYETKFLASRQFVQQFIRALV
jgi:hypothetical protein